MKKILTLIVLCVVANCSTYTKSKEKYECNVEHYIETEIDGKEVTTLLKKEEKVIFYSHVSYSNIYAPQNTLKGKNIYYSFWREGDSISINHKIYAFKDCKLLDLSKAEQILEGQKYVENYIEWWEILLYMYMYGFGGLFLIVTFCVWLCDGFDEDYDTFCKIIFFPFYIPYVIGNHFTSKIFTSWTKKAKIARENKRLVEYESKDFHTIHPEIILYDNGDDIEYINNKDKDKTGKYCGVVNAGKKIIIIQNGDKYDEVQFKLVKANKSLNKRLISNKGKHPKVDEFYTEVLKNIRKGV